VIALENIQTILLILSAFLILELFVICIDLSITPFINMYRKKYRAEKRQLLIAQLFKDFFKLNGLKQLIAITVIVLSLIPIYKYFYGNEVIGSFLEKTKPYEVQYYVNLFEDTKVTKNYRLKADITVQDRNIELEKVYWPNGGYLTFYTNENDSLEFNKKIYCVDSKGTIYYIELTNQKVE
jgi:preprotein translocase subunit SecE